MNFFFSEHSKHFCEQLDPYAITVRMKHLNIVHHINWIAPSSAEVVASVEIYIWNLYLTLACGKHSAAGIDCYSQTGQLFPLWIGIRFRLTTLQQSQNRRNQSLSQFVVKSLNSSATENSILFSISNKFKGKNILVWLKISLNLSIFNSWGVKVHKYKGFIYFLNVVLNFIWPTLKYVDFNISTLNRGKPDKLVWSLVIRCCQKKICWQQVNGWLASKSESFTTQSQSSTMFYFIINATDVDLIHNTGPT